MRHGETVGDSSIRLYGATDVALSELLRGLVASRGLTLVCVTHDIAFAERVAQDLVVLHAGEVVERGEAAAVINAPKDSRTRELLARG